MLLLEGGTSGKSLQSHTNLRRNCGQFLMLYERTYNYFLLINKYLPDIYSYFLFFLPSNYTPKQKMYFAKAETKRNAIVESRKEEAG